ncbi:MAG: hypothetical protein JW783_04015 [Bacteroidales bacterium]|nr:hypothetical protein [Bacteroidales bacterium]MBN2748545.1 hypothetical protein [Bacteroidales bacterium]
MKKILLYIALAIGATSLISCQEELEIWDSAVLDYSGRFLFELQDETGTATLVGFDDAQQIYIYSTASNVANEVWIEDVDHLFPFKCKQRLTGNANSFASASLDFNNLENNLLAIEPPTTSKPLGLGETVIVDRDYIRVAIEEAKILKGAATTVGGNVADSLYMKVRLYCGSVTFASYKLPQSLWADPEVEEFGWELESVTYDNTLDESYVIAGHRYTGFPEDHYK